MTEDSQAVWSAWQPLTPAGVAAFARSSWSRLFLVQLFVAAIIGVVVVWFFMTNCSPAITHAINQMPDEAVLEAGQLKNVGSRIFAQTRFLSLTVDVGEPLGAGNTADLQLELAEWRFQICWLAGCASFPYPRDRLLAVGRSTAEPWWGAWSPMLMAALGVATVISLFASWMIMATVYFPVSKTIAYFADRDLSWTGSWRLASAGLMPGALLMATGVVLYGVGTIDLIRLGILLALHLVVGWIYLGFAAFCLPKIIPRGMAGANPFAGGLTSAAPETPPKNQEKLE